MTKGESPDARAFDAEEKKSTEERAMVLGRLSEAGWECGGGDTLISGRVTQINIGIIREEGRLSISPQEAIERLGLAADEESALLPGYEVMTDEKTGALEFGYEGPDDERHKQFLEDVIALGIELDKVQARAIEDFRAAALRLGPGGIAKVLRTLDDEAWGPMLIAAFAEMQRGELVDITPSDEPTDETDGDTDEEDVPKESTQDIVTAQWSEEELERVYRSGKDVATAAADEALETSGFELDHAVNQRTREVAKKAALIALRNLFPFEDLAEIILCGDKGTQIKFEPVKEEARWS